MREEEAKYVLDSFAILAYLAEEEGADVVEDLLNKAENGAVKLIELLELSLRIPL